MASVFLFVSCSQYDTPEVEVVNKFDYSAFDEFSKTNSYINVKKTIKNNKKNTESKSTLETNKFILKVVNDEMDTNLFYPDLALKLNDFNKYNVDDIFKIAKENKWMNEEDIILTNSIISDIESLGFEKAVKNFEEKVLKMSLTQQKFTEKNNFINSLKSINYENPNLFAKTLNSKSWLKCAAASVAFTAAFVGLSGCATIVACGLAVVLFYAASNSFAANCIEK